MTQINQNFDNKYQQQPQRAVASARPTPVPQVRIPDYYKVDVTEQKDWREQIKSNPLTMVPYEFLLRGTEHPISTLLTWLGVGYGLDKYSQSCSGAYDKSLLNKVATAGDKLEQSKFVQSKPSQFVLGGFKLVGKGWDKLKSHSAILRALSTPTMPEWSMPKQEMLPHKLKVCEDFFKITDTLHLLDDKQASLKDIVLGSKEKDALKTFFKTNSISKIPEKDAVNFLLLKQLGKKDTEISNILAKGAGATEATKDEILKTLNNLTRDSLKKAHKEISNGDLSGEYYKKVFEAAKSAQNKVKIRAGHYPVLGHLSRPFERVIGCDEVYNKLWSISGGAKTSTGKFLAQIMQMTQRGLTFGQGKLGLLLLIAPSLVDVGINVAKAEPKEKIGTAANGFVTSISWVLTFPLALHIMHAFGGIRYAGMSPTQIREYRKALDAFNKTNNEFGFRTKAEYNTAKKAVLDKLKVKNQNIFTKGVRKLARVLTLDLETFNARKTSNAAMNFLRKTPNFFKNVFGVPVRFGVWSLIAMFGLEAGLEKITSMIFGRSYDAEKDTERKEAKKAQKQFLKEDLNKRLYEAQMKKQYGSNPKLQYANSQAQMLSHRGKNIAMPQEETQKLDNYTYIPSSENIIKKSSEKTNVDNYTYIPSQDSTIKPKDGEANPSEKRTYIPSQEAANIQKTWDNSGLASALARADRAENKALRILAGNFDGM